VAEVPELPRRMADRKTESMFKKLAIASAIIFHSPKWRWDALLEFNNAKLQEKFLKF
jgi:hypothetical protein